MYPTAFQEGEDLQWDVAGWACGSHQDEGKSSSPRPLGCCFSVLFLYSLKYSQDTAEGS